MKRNKRTEIKGHEELTPLTDQILAEMGEDGKEIRKRLREFYRQRAFRKRVPGEVLGKGA